MSPPADTARSNPTLAASLAPLVVQACDGRLGEIHWFKTDWQRGGAATGRATFHTQDGQSVPVVLKLPVVQREFLWTLRLQDHIVAHSSSLVDSELPPLPVIPRLYGSGETLGGYDLAWIVIEHFQYGPLGLHWHDDHITRITQAAARFHAAAAQYPIDQVPTAEPWDELLEQSIHNARTNNIDHRQRWGVALKAMKSRATKLVHEWNNRDESQWLHGDLHLANAMSREGGDSGPVCLIDLAEVHAGHWVEDAIYLERQLWARPERLKNHKPVKELATARKQLGLPVDAEYPRLAMIRRAMLAATAPKYMKSEGHPAYLEACLNWLEIALTELK